MATNQVRWDAANDSAPPRVLSREFTDRLVCINRAARVLRQLGLPVAKTEVALTEASARITLDSTRLDSAARKLAELHVCGGVIRLTHDGMRLATGRVHGVRVTWEEPAGVAGLGEDE